MIVLLDINDTHILLMKVLSQTAYYAGIMPDAFRYSTYYAKNYAGMIGLGLNIMLA